VDIRLKQHQWHIWLEYLDKLVRAEHSIDQGHHIQFQNSSILATETRYMYCIVREPIEIELHSYNINREGGFCLSKSWKPLTSSLSHLLSQSLSRKLCQHQWTNKWAHLLASNWNYVVVVVWLVTSFFPWQSSDGIPMQYFLHSSHRLPGNVFPVLIRSGHIFQQRLSAWVDYTVQQLPLVKIRLLTVEQWLEFCS
jgi:hypothetical protein